MTNRCSEEEIRQAEEIGRDIASVLGIKDGLLWILTPSKDFGDKSPVEFLAGGGDVSVIKRAIHLIKSGEPS